MPYDVDYNKTDVHNKLKSNERLSSFNGLSAISYKNQRGTNLNVSDLQRVNQNQDGNPPISSIIANSADLSPADFLYAKQFGKVPNNRLVICRRYHYPVHDILPPFPPIAKMVTWLDKDVEDIIPEISLSMNFEDVGVEEGSIGQIAGKLPGFGSSGDNFDFTGTQRVLDQLNFSSNMKENKTEELLGATRITDNAKFRTLGQNSDVSFEYKFSYKMKYIDGVDPKLALLDALANAMVIAYDNTRFYKLDGGEKFVFNKVDQYKYYDYEKINETLGLSIADGIAGIGSRLEEAYTAFGEDGFSKEAFKDVISGSRLLSSSRDMIKRLYYLYTFMTGAPSGFWHLTIGNPFNPIAVWGNLVCSDAKIKFSNELGKDDFPEGFDMILTLVPARALSRDELVSKFNNAEGGLYKPPNNSNQNLQNPEITNAVRDRWLKNQQSTQQGKYTRQGVQDSLDMISGTQI